MPALQDMENKKWIWHYIWITITSLVVGSVFTVLTYFGVIIFLLVTRSLHTSGSFPVHIYDIPPIVGIWVTAGTFKLGAVVARKKSADSKKKPPVLQNMIILLLAILASIAVYVITSATGHHS